MIDKWMVIASFIFRDDEWWEEGQLLIGRAAWAR
jgi:hypothetical protein